MSHFPENSINYEEISQSNIKTLVNHFNSLNQSIENEVVTSTDHKKSFLSNKKKISSENKINTIAFEQVNDCSNSDNKIKVDNIKDYEVSDVVLSSNDLEINHLPQRPSFINLPSKIYNHSCSEKNEIQPLFAKRPQSLNISNLLLKIENSIDSSDSNTTPLCSEVFHIPLLDVNLDSHIYDITNQDMNTPRSTNIDLSLIELGRIAPVWMADACTARCLQCRARFTFTKRRHHCRTCGKIFCSACCKTRVRLYYLDLREARVCNVCLEDLLEAQKYITKDMIENKSNKVETITTNEANRMAKLTTSILKKVSNSKRFPEKRVTFVDETLTSRDLYCQPKNTINKDGEIIFPVNNNISIKVFHLLLDCCCQKRCLYYTTSNLLLFNDYELIVIHQASTSKPLQSIVTYLSKICKNIIAGQKVEHLQYIETEPDEFFETMKISGYLFVRPTFQCTLNLPIPPGTPLLFAIQVMESESYIARHLSIQFILSLGLHFKCYPCPLFNNIYRESIFQKNIFSFIHSIEPKMHIPNFCISIVKSQIYLSVDKDQQSMLLKLINVSENCLMICADLNLIADNHLVCVQQNNQLTTQLVQVNTTKKQVTGASFIILIVGKQSQICIIEDGLLISLSQSLFQQIKVQIKNMQDFRILLQDASKEIIPLNFQWLDIKMSDVSLLKCLLNDTMSFSCKNWRQNNVQIFHQKDLNFKYVHSFLFQSNDLKLLSLDENELKIIKSIELLLINNLGNQINKGLLNVDAKQMSLRTFFNSNNDFELNLYVPTNDKEDVKLAVSEILSTVYNNIKNIIFNYKKDLLIKDNICIESFFICFKEL